MIFEYNLIFHGIFPIICLFFNSIFQLILIRIFYTKYLINIILGFLLGFFLLNFFELLFFLSNDFNLSYLFLIYFNYFLFSFAYFVCLSTGKTSLRVRLLTEINTRSNGIKLSELYDKYNSRDITNIRILRLLKNKQIMKKNDRYFYKFSLTLLISLFLDLAKLVFFGKKKCLYSGFNLDQ